MFIHSRYPVAAAMLAAFDKTLLDLFRLREDDHMTLQSQDQPEMSSIKSQHHRDNPGTESFCKIMPEKPYQTARLPR